MRTRSAPIGITSEIAQTGEFSAVVATERRDAYGDELSLTGADLLDYQQNPVLLYAHDRREPIGRMLALDSTVDAITARFRLLSQGVSEVADRVRAMIAENVLNAVSVGFLPLESEPIPGAGSRFTRWRLAEVSVVPLPANPDALIVARAAPDSPSEVSMSDPAAVTAPVDLTAQVAAILATIAANPATPLQTVPLVPPKARTLADHVLGSDLLTRAAKGGPVRDDFPLTLRALGTPAITGAGNIAVSTPAAFIGVDSNYAPAPRLIDYLPVIPVSSGHIVHDVLTPTPKAAAKVPEGTAKPYQVFTAQGTAVDIPTYAVLVKVSKQLLADLPAIRTLMDQTLGGLVLDAVDAGAFEALTTAGAFTPWSGAQTGENTFDGIARIVSALQVVGARSIVVAINPADALSMTIAKAQTAGVYLLPPQLPARIVAVSAVPAGKAFAFDQTAVALAVREEVGVEIGLDGDDWSKNLRTLLAEARALALTRRPALVMYGNLTAA